MAAVGAAGWLLLVAVGVFAGREWALYRTVRRPRRIEHSATTTSCRTAAHRLE